MERFVGATQCERAKASKQDLVFGSEKELQKGASMAYVNFSEILRAEYHKEQKEVVIYGQINRTFEIYQLIAEGELEDFTDLSVDTYVFDLTDQADFRYCLNWVNSRLKEQNIGYVGVKFTDKLKHLAGLRNVGLQDNRSVREAYEKYWADQRAQSEKAEAEVKAEKKSRSKKSK